MIKKFLFFVFYIFIFLPLFFFILFIRIFVKFKIVEMETRAIGHFSLPVEIFLCEIKSGIHGKKERLVWFANKKISNLFLYKKWKEVCFVGPRIIFEKIFKLSNNIKFFGNIFLSPYRHWSKTTYWQAIDIYNVLNKIEPIIKFNKNEHNLANNFFKKNSLLIDKKFVCFFSRSNYYRGGDACIRDSSIYSQIKGIKRVCDDGFYAFRMSKIDKNSPLNTKNKNLFDYAYCADKSDFLDIYLLYHCTYMISTGSGIEEVPKLNRKKIVLVDYCDAKSMHRLELVPIILPKKIISLKTKKEVGYDEIFRKDLLQPNATHASLRMLGYDYLDNTEDEVEMAIMEMHSHIIYGKKIENNFLNEKFWSLYEKYYKKRRPINTYVSTSFLNKNKNLLN